MPTSALQFVTDPPPLPDRPVAGHKGLFGRVLVVGGSEAMFGAAVLTGTAALRCGSGLVQLALPWPAVPFALSVTPELIALPLSTNESDRERLVAAADSADALVIGPGLGRSALADERVQWLTDLHKPAVLDADALNILAAQPAWPNVRLKAVLTPHPGEMARLAPLLGRKDVPTDEPGRIELAVAAARAFGQVLLLKGMGTVVTDGQLVYVNRTGDSSLSKAGTGDVLSGIIGSLLGQGMEPFSAAAAGAWLHGKAGELAGQRLGLRSVLARDVIDALPQAIGLYEKR